MSCAKFSGVKSCRLLLRSPADIRVLWQPPAGVNWRRILVVSAAVTSLFLAGLGWVFSLRRQVALQTRQITERLEREAGLEARLRQAQKMESIGQLAAGVAHDFNNMLTVIQGHAALLSSEPELSAEARESAAEIANAGDRAADLTRQLLAFSRKQPLQLRILDINVVVNGVTKLIRRLVGESISLNISMDSKLPPLKGDPGMLQQVIMNLAVNARDAMPCGGVLEIRTFLQTVNGKTDLGVERNGAFLCLSVRDTGKGMSDEVKSRIFEPFFTTKEVGKGTGLGLATVDGIVQQHGGWIDLASAPGQGTVFEVHFPVYKEPPSVG